MASPTELLEVHGHLADASLALARAVQAGAAVGELLPLARLITEAQAELLKVTRGAPSESRPRG